MNFDNCDTCEVSTKELKEQVLSPNEPNVNIQRIAKQTRSEKKHRNCSRSSATRSTRDPGRQYGDMGGAFKNDLEWECLDLSEALENLRGKQELLGCLMKGKVEFTESRT